jgi:hypothetical protein
VTTPSDRVKALVRQGSIAPDEGERLLSALGEKRPSSALRTLVRPFDRFGGEVTALLGLPVALLAVATTRLGLEYDGAFDVHTTHAPPSLLRAAAEQAIAVLFPAVLFYVYALLWKQRARLIDFVGVTGFSRLPLVVAALFAGVLRLTEATPRAVTLLIAIVVISCLAVTLTLFYQGMKSASGLRGARVTFGFVVVLAGAELLSKLVLHFVS